MHTIKVGITGRTDEYGTPLVFAAAWDEDGNEIASHTSGSDGWAFNDMMERPSKHEQYAKRYPDGYQLMWIGDENADNT